MPAKPDRPQHDPAALPAAAETLQAAAARLLDAGAPLADVTALAEAARDYAAEHAAAEVARLDRSIGLRSPSPLYAKPIAAVRATVFPLAPDTREHEHVWVTALDGNDEPARDADGRTWMHCGVCGTPRPEVRPTMRERHRAAWNALTPAEQEARIAALDAEDARAEWTLAYEAEPAAWTLRYGTGADTVVYASTSEFEPVAWYGAQEWAARELAANHGVTVTDWAPYRPGLLPYPAHWIAKTEEA